MVGNEAGAPADVSVIPKLPSLAASPEAKPGQKRELIILADDNAVGRKLLGIQNLHAPAFNN